jgi:competence protein ComEC
MLPALPVFIIAGGLAAVFTGLSADVGQVFGWPAWLLGEYMTRVADLFAGLPPGPVQTEGWGGAALVMYFTLLVLALEWRWAVRTAGTFAASLRRMLTGPVRTGRPDRKLPALPVWLLLTAVVAASVTWAGALSSDSSDQLTITFFETDRGDLILIETPNGNTALIDGGRDPGGAVAVLDEALPFWDRSLEIVLLTHPDADHVGGLQAVLERYGVGAIVESPVEHDTTVHASWRTAVERHGGQIVVPPGALIALDDGVTLEVLSAGLPFADAAINDASIVTMLRFGEFSALLTGDITSLVEQRLVASGADLRATVLKVPHHGSATSSGTAFLEAVSPVAAVIQVGTQNTFGHPDPDVVERLKRVVDSDYLFNTSRDGTVILRSDGSKLWVETER